MVQFQRKNIPYGSQENNGELRLASIESILRIDEDARMQAYHYTALVLMSEIDEGSIVNLVDKKEVGGLVIIIPSSVLFVWLGGLFSRLMKTCSLIARQWKNTCCSDRLPVLCISSRRRRM